MELPISIFRTARSLPAHEGVSAIPIMGLPPIRFFAGKFALHGKASTAGFLLLNHFESVGQFSLHELLAVIKRRVAATAGYALLGVAAVAVALPTFVTTAAAVAAAPAAAIAVRIVAMLAVLTFAVPLLAACALFLLLVRTRGGSAACAAAATVFACSGSAD